MLLSLKLVPLFLGVSVANGAIQVDLKKLDGSIIRATVTNTGASDEQLLKDPYSVLMPELPTDKFSFAPKDGGASPEFQGVAVKWVPEIAAQEGDFVIIPAGKSVNFDHDISQAYSSPSGEPTEYIITLIQSTFISTSGLIPFALPGIEIPGLPLFKRHIDDIKLVKRVSFVGCTPARQRQIQNAATEAQVLATAALGYLEPRLGTPRYTTWFGAVGNGRVSTVIDHFQKISNGQLARDIYDCSTCNEKGVFAYVYPNKPGKIYLCPAFWPAPLTGTDSKAGTLVHEASHFTVNGGTKDFAYGQAKCKSLAKKDPASAIRNADSHEYFAENNPLLV